jgi:hypothetical protein
MDKKDPKVTDQPTNVVVLEGRPFTIIGDGVLERYQCLVQEFEELMTTFKTSQEFKYYSTQELETTIQGLKVQCVRFKDYDEFVTIYKYSSPETHSFIINIQKMQIRAYERLNDLHKIELTKLQERHKLSKGKSSQDRKLEKPPIRKEKPPLQSKASKDPKGIYCSYCNQTDHAIYKCDQFASAQMRVKLSIVRDKKLCFRCLRENHLAIDCKVRFLCKIDSCHKKHHRLLHTDKVGKFYLSLLIAQGIGNDFTTSEEEEG